MKKPSFFIPGVLIFIVSIPVVFLFLFAIGTISTNSAKSIHLDWVKNYESTIKNQFSQIEESKIYYQQGSVHFDFTINSKMSLDECKQVIKITKSFFEKEIASGMSLAGGYADQVSISIKFESNKNIYVFRSPYWIPYTNNLVKNDYKEWYLKINDEAEIKIQF